MSGDNAMLAAPLVLPEDVLVFSVSELAPEITERSAFDPKNFVITRKNARLPSKVVDADAAALIEVFRKPRTIVEGVLAFSSDRRLDPRRVLDEAFPMLGEFLSAGILVLASSTFARSIQLSLAVGDVIGGARVEAPIQLMEDTEVYRVVSENGSQAALKMARAGHEARVGRALAREAALLARLQGCAAPSLFEEGTHAGRPYLLLEWCEGQPALAAARQLQSPIAMERSPRLLALCVAVLRAYATLHAHGIVHGDVHPNNVLVTEEGAVRLVDFGLGRVLYDSDWLGAPPRAARRSTSIRPARRRCARSGRRPPSIHHPSNIRLLCCCGRCSLAAPIWIFPSSMMNCCDRLSRSRRCHLSDTARRPGPMLSWRSRAPLPRILSGVSHLSRISPTRWSARRQARQLRFVVSPCLVYSMRFWIGSDPTARRFGLSTIPRRSAR